MPAGQTGALPIDRILDLDRYPLVDMGDDGAGRQRLIDRCRRQLRADGACQLDRLLLPEALRAVVDDAKAKEARSFRTEAVHNVYFVDVPADAADDDPRAMMVRSAKRALSWRHVGEQSPLRALYEWDGLVSFLRDVLELASLYRDADPDGACSVMFYDEGDELGWHFDNSEFSVTLMLQASDAGGAYEFVPADEDRRGRQPRRS